MSELLYLDTWLQPDCTLGRLSYSSFQCFTLELPWLENQQNVSCIPAGHYNCAKYDSLKHGDVILLQDVPRRSMIEIHAGNYTSEILGCILPGSSITYLNQDTVPDVASSKATLRKLLAALPEEFEMSITRTGS